MDVVTGSFGYIGKYITRELLEKGHTVKTITTHPDKPNPFGGKVEAASYHFEKPEMLTRYLEGCETLYNTYWVRFNYRQWSFDKALENTKILFHCAKNAGVRKIVHISVTNPSEKDDLPYYKGKALQEKELRELGVGYTIVRPTLVFGKEDILVNNIAWTIRKFPIVPIFGSGKYKVQPVFVEDLAKLTVEASRSEGSPTIDAIGPEAFTYEAFLQLIARELNRKVAFVHTSPSLGIILGKLIGLFVEDVVLTKDELRGLILNKLTSNQDPNGRTLFSDWLRNNKHSIGTRYTSELNRHFNWRGAA
ncbi:MAG: NAD(P)H-binding protein [Anaerolineales bacterium]|jgi:NADH dehydrogenase